MLTPALDDVNARARGLGTHLLGRPELERLARSPGSGALARSLEALGYPPVPLETAALVQQIDAGVGRGAARRLGLLARWLGARREAFAVVFEDEDRRTIRTLLRRVGEGLPEPARLLGVTATPALPERLLRTLARSATLADFASALARAGSPYGEALGAPDGGLLALELALQRAFARRARAGARRGGPALRAFARETIDLENAWSALLGEAGAETEAGAEEAFLEGGERLPRERYWALRREDTVPRRLALLARAFAGTAVSGVFAARGDGVPAVSTLEARALVARIAAQRRAARLDPIGPAPLLAYLLRLRAEASDLRSIAWGVAAAIPAASILRELVVAS